MEKVKLQVVSGIRATQMAVVRYSRAGATPVGPKILRTVEMQLSGLHTTSDGNLSVTR
jgi:hypothetical protein